MNGDKNPETGNFSSVCVLKNINAKFTSKITLYDQANIL